MSKEGAVTSLCWRVHLPCLGAAACDVEVSCDLARPASWHCPVTCPVTAHKAQLLPAPPTRKPMDRAAAHRVSSDMAAVYNPLQSLLKFILSEPTSEILVQLGLGYAHQHASCAVGWCQYQV